MFFLAASICLIGAAGPSYAAIEARGAILMNIKSGSVLYVQSEDVKIPPASLAKIMTMHLAMDKISAGQAALTDSVNISPRAARQPGARMGLTAGEVVSLDKLLTGTAVASGNDAAVAVAEHISGTVEKFVREMNAKASELDMRGTTFRNPNGLPSSSQVTTALDMLKLSRSYIENHPDALRYHSISEITHGDRTTTNKNPLLRLHSLVDGLKTGWIRASKHNLITTARSGDVRLISVVLGAPTSTDLTEGSAMLIDAGFITVGSGGRIKVREQLEGPPGMYAGAESDRADAAPEDISPDMAGAPGAAGADAVRNIGAGEIAAAVAGLCARSNRHLSDSAIELLLSPDDSDKDAPEEMPGSLPMCARPRTTMVLAEVGQDVHVTGGSLNDAIRGGVRRGSWNHWDAVAWPVSGEWGTDDLPCVIHYNIVPGGRLRINVLPIGFEGEGRFDVTSSPHGLIGVMDFIARTAKNALPGLCPPVTVGVGIGKTMEESAFMARRALARGINEYNDDESWARLESGLLRAINDPDADLPGFGDFDAVLAVNIEASRENISNMAVVIYISCHATSEAEIIL